MGTPAYQTDMGRFFRDVSQDQQDAFTARHTRAASYRPWQRLGIMDADSSRWKTTTVTGWADYHIIGGVNTHPKYTLYVAAIVPAGGSEIRGLWQDGSTVLFGPHSMSTTSSAIAYFPYDYVLTGLSSPPNYYESFYFKLQARSVVSGQSTILSSIGSWGVESSHSAVIPS